MHFKRASEPSDPPGLGRWERIGTTLPRSQRQRLIILWLKARALIAVVLGASGLAFGLYWDWSPGFLILALATLSCLSSLERLSRRDFSDPVSPLLLDVTVIFVGLLIAEVPDSSIGIVFSYMIVSTLLLTTIRKGTWVLAYGAIWYIGIVRNWIVAEGHLTDGQRIVTGTLAGVIFVIAFAGLIAVMIRVMNWSWVRQSRQARTQAAIAGAANALLHDRGERALESSLRSLLDATDAMSVFVEKNVDHPELGLCTTFLAGVRREGAAPSVGTKWELVPWARVSGRSALERGESVEVHYSTMTGDERALYEGTGIETELDIPVFVNGEWWGVVGFTHGASDKRWGRVDESLLFTAADLIGAYIARKDTQAELERVADDLDAQVRYQEGLAECARLLQAVGEPGVLDQALEVLRETVNAKSARLVELWSHPGAGTPRASQEDADADKPVPQSGTQDLEVPIFVEGTPRAAIVLTPRREDRVWTDSEIDSLQVAARMIGGFWERTEAHQRLSRMFRVERDRLRYEMALSNSSRALLSTDSETAIDDVLEHLLDATDTQKVFVDWNIDDPVDGTIAVVMHEAIRKGYEDVVDPEIWEEDDGSVHHWEVPYRLLPRLEAELRSGRPGIVVPRLLDETEREAYTDDPIKSELNIPIFAHGSWIGAIGFADYLEERQWAPEDISLLQTAAEMIGSFWERRESRRRLEQLVQAKDSFVAAVSHELRTPLTSVVGLACELRDARDEFTDDEVGSLIEVVAEQSTQVADIVNDLLVAAKADIGTLATRLEMLPLSEIIDSLGRTRIFEKFAEVRWDNLDVEVWADRGRMHQIVRNLIINAARHGGDVLEVRAVREADRSRLIVRDNGDGVREDLIDEIFRPYGRGAGQPTQPESLGLGLAVARHLARLMDGKLTYRRSDGWTEFELNLPSKPDAGSDDVPHSDSAESEVWTAISH